MKKHALVIGLLTILSTPVMASNGIIQIESRHAFQETIDLFTNTLKTKGMKIFATIPHSQGAANVGIKMRPTALVIFGNPKAGAPLMACQQTVGLDLPQKALISADENGKIWFSYNDPGYLKSRHAIEGCDDVLDNIGKALKELADAATK